MKRPTLPMFHPLGVAAGALLTALGVVLTETLLGPLLARSLVPPQEAMISGVHRALVEQYVVPRDGEWLMHRAVEGMLDGLDDPYSFFIGGQEALRQLKEDSSGRLIGIGALIQGDGTLRYPRPGGPAEAAGLLPGDRFLAVNGEDVTGLDSGELVKRLKGEPNTRVALVMQRHDQTRYQTELVRTAMPTVTVRQARIIDEQAAIGHIHINSFAHSTPAELDAALEKLEAQNVRGLVLDLRFNPGGILPAAVDVAARFLRGGVVTTLLPRAGEPQAFLADPGAGRAAHLPVVLLLNGYSASGSEVVAGALRDHGAAILAGTPSYGKGVYQQVRTYSQGHFALKFAAGYYVTPSGHILEGHLDENLAGGLSPDIYVPVDALLESEIAASLALDEPPEQYREQVYAIFPNVANYERPEDPVLAKAVEALRAALGET